MNKNKICFIMYTNDEMACGENILYLQNLMVPSGMEVDCLTVNHENGMLAAYEEGRQQSDAKYKVYYSQDVFILHKNFIQDVIKVFESDEKIGLLGICGKKNVVMDDNNEKEQNKISGKVIECRIGENAVLCEYDEIAGMYEEVEEVDGTILVTSYDLPWTAVEKDACCGEIVSKAYYESGYKVVVPCQESAWCLQDRYM